MHLGSPSFPLNTGPTLTTPRALWGRNKPQFRLLLLGSLRERRGHHTVCQHSTGLSPAPGPPACEPHPDARPSWTPTAPCPSAPLLTGLSPLFTGLGTAPRTRRGETCPPAPPQHQTRQVGLPTQTGGKAEIGSKATRGQISGEAQCTLGRDGGTE